MAPLEKACYGRLLRSLAAVGVLAWSGPADAGSAPTPPPVPATAVAISSGINQLAPRTNALTHKPYGNGMLHLGYQYFDPAAGLECVYTTELEDMYSAVQFAFASDDAASAYTIDQSVVAPSSTLGTGKFGVSAYDYSGVAAATMAPVTFNHGGTFTDFFDGYPANRAGDAKSGTEVYSVPVSGAVASGATAITIGAAGSLQGSPSVAASSAAPIYVSAGPNSGAVPAGTTATISGATLTLSNATTAALINGQSIYLSYAPLTLSLAIPASTNPVQPQWLYSDPIEMQSLFRTDGGFVAGDALSGPGIASGAVAWVVGPNYITMSSPATATQASQVAVTGTRTTTTTAAVAATYGYSLTVASVVGIHPGRIVTDATGYLPAGSVVLSVQGNKVWLNHPPAATIPSGTSIAFLTTAYTETAASSGIASQALTGTAAAASVTAGSPNVYFRSISQRPLLTLRVSATGASSSNTVTTYNQALNGQMQEVSNGLGLNMFYLSTLAGRDIINSVSGATNSNGVNPSSSCPVFFVRYLSMHRGIDMPMFGNSQTAGKSTVTDSMNFGRLAAAQISKPTLPIEAPNFGISGQWANDYLTAAAQYIGDTKPPLVFLQGMDRNSTRDTSSAVFAQVMGVARKVQANGGRVILATESPWGGRTPGDQVVGPAGVTNGTYIPLLNSALNTLSNVAYYGTDAVTGAPVSGFLSEQHYAMNATASAATTISGGTVLHTNQVTTASAVSASTSIPLTSPYTAGGSACTATGTSITVPAAINSAVGATTLVVTTPQTIAAGTVLTIQCGDTYPADRQFWRGLERNTMADGDNSLTLFDLNAALENPADPMFYLPNLTSDDIHANDIGQPVAATAFVPVLKQAAGLP